MYWNIYIMFIQTLYIILLTWIAVYFSEVNRTKQKFIQRRGEKMKTLITEYKLIKLIYSHLVKKKSQLTLGDKMGDIIDGIL